MKFFSFIFLKSYSESIKKMEKTNTFLFGKVAKLLSEFGYLLPQILDDLCSLR